MDIGTSYHIKLRKECGSFDNWERVGGYDIGDGYDPNNYSFYYYAINKYPDMIQPSLKNHCACSHWILYNYWIRNSLTKEIKVIGSDCIQQFNIDGGSSKKCNNCGVFHNVRRRKKEKKIPVSKLLCMRCRDKKDYEEKLKLRKIRNEKRHKRFEDKLKKTKKYKDRQKQTKIDNMFKRNRKK
jgi:hypothetical protein